MASVGTVRLAAVWKALDECLPGCRREETKHHWVVYPPDGGPPYRRLPKGSHGSRRRATVERGHVKRMARQFGVLDCMLERCKGL